MTSSDAELPRNAIFLSYASEDVVLMRWLAGKLATAGYAVWCDQWRLFGGLDWPSEIDVAIKQHTARMVALVSQHSLRKPNPQREWTLGLTLEQERKEKGFLIPLNVDGQPSSAFPWQLAGRQYVACQRWDEGLDGLLRALEEYRVPRPLTNQGASLSLLPLEPMQVLREEPEELVTNRFAILDIPAVLKRYRPARSFTRAELEFIRATWPTREGGDGYLYAFGDPPDNLLPAPVSPAGALVWTDGKAIGERPAAHLVKPILRDAVTAHGLARGLERWPEVKGLRFPEGLVLENTIFFRHPSGRPGKCRMVGDRLPGKPRAFRYHIGFVPFIQHTGNDRFVIEVKLRLWTTSPDGIPYIGKAANARRRYLAKRWFNTEWRNRIRGIGVFLAGGGQRLTRTPEPFPVSLGAGATVLVASQPIRVLVTPSLDEAMLESVRRRFGPRAGGEADHVAGA